MSAYLLYKQTDFTYRNIFPRLFISFKFKSQPIYQLTHI